MDIISKSQNLVKIIKEASSVFLMAHKDLDLDAINSCIGMDYYLKRANKTSYIIIDDKIPEPGVKKVLDVEANKRTIIKSKMVEELVDESSLLIILDTNKEKLVQNPDVIKLFKKTINIDHHDKTKESIKTNLSIIDEDTSSTCEMLTEFLKENEIKLTSKIATLLLGGIILDTNYYRANVSPETFYNSYYLTKCGAKVNDINELLKQNIKDYIKRQKIISSAKVINNIAIGKGLQRSEYKKEELAKTADSLLTFNKIIASFVVAKIDKDIIGISGRSMGEINVGQILEMFGGGGTEMEGAAKIENSNVNKVIEELSIIIRSL